MKSKTIEFNKANHNFGWLSIWSPHGIRFKNQLWPNCANAWYGVRNNKPPNNAKIGTRVIKEYEKNTQQTNDEDLNILTEILQLKIVHHPILKKYLQETENNQIVFSVSHNDTLERKWLGVDNKTRIGENILGNLWMQIRENSYKQHDN